MNCPNCQSENPEGALFCATCGTRLPQKCSNCGAALPPGANFCPNCGHPVAVGPASTQPTAAPPSPPAAPDQLIRRYLPKELLAKLESARSSHLMRGERRVVTILFCDVHESTAAAAQLDPEDWAEIINGAFENMIQPIYRYEGTVARLQGDGVLAFFGAPVAHEDDPERAVLAGLEIVQAIQPYSESVRKQWNTDLKVRVGINTGLVVVGEVGSDLRVEYTALGDAINLAARMEQHAPPGSVLIAEPTYRLVAPLFDFEAVENLNLKGYAQPVTAYRPLQRKEQPGSLRGLIGLSAPLIGRQEQMQALWSAAEGLNQGQGQIISVIGEAGLGKSRLVRDFARDLQAAQPSVQWLEGRTLSYQSSLPFAPFIDLLARLLGPSGGSDYPALQERLHALIGDQGGETAPYLAHLLGIPLEAEAAERIQYIPPQRLRATFFAHITSLLEHMLAAGPVVLYLDDLHWCDPTSFDLLQSLLPLTGRFPLMILTAFRPLQSEPSWQYHLQIRQAYDDRYHVLNLAPLSDDQSLQLVSSLLKIDDLPETIRRKIMEKAEGNPFYLEEVIRSLLDSGLIVRENERWHAAADIDHITLPDTLVGVITARLDRLSDENRSILQAAAVLGREFSPALLREIVQVDPNQLDADLDVLTRRALILEISPKPQQVYSFKHVLTQEAAYQSVLLSRRRVLHHRAAEAMIERTPAAAGEIAHHLLEARLSERAVPYLVQAGDQANLAYALDEAIRYFRQAKAIEAAADPKQRIAIYTGLGHAITSSNRIPEALEIYREMQTVGETVGDIQMQVSALNKQASVMALYLGQFQESEHLLERAEQLALQHNEKSGIPEMHLLRCLMCTAQADFENVVYYMDQVVQVGEEQNNPHFVAMGMVHVATSLIYLTRFEQAEEHALKALQVTRQIGDRMHETHLLSEALPLIAFHHGDFEQAETYLQQGLQIANRINYLESQSLSAYFLAELARWRGDYENALSYASAALKTALPLEEYTPFVLPPILGSLGMIYLEISPQFHDKTLELHQHALRVLETPMGMLMGGLPWADLGLCAVMTGDLPLAETVIATGLNTPNTFALIERPRQVAAAAQLAGLKSDWAEAIRLADEARADAEGHALRQHFPLTALVQGEMRLGAAQYTEALAALETAQQEAGAFGMRPITWQAHAAAAQAHEALGRIREAEQARAAADRVIAEIAGQFEDQELRQIFLAAHKPLTR